MADIPMEAAPKSTLNLFDDEAPSTPEPPPPIDTRLLTAEERTLQALILERGELLQVQDLFERLNLPRSANAAAVKAAYFKTAQLFHPDRLPKNLAGLAAKQREVFNAVKEAYDTLVDDDQRRAYLGSREKPKYAGPGAAAFGSDPKDAAQKGEAFLDKGDYASAEQAFHAAYEMGKSGDHLAAELWCRRLVPARKSEEAEIRKKLAEASVKHPDSTKAPYFLGLLARMEGQTDEAERLFRKVLAVNPQHPEASQELRIMELRKKKKR
jgi:curved DNA-binding protein CbpA